MFVSSGARQDAQVAALLTHERVGRVVVLSDNLFRQASQLADSVGPIAIIDTPRQGLPAILDQEFVYLDRVQDPGNIGTILRTCAAAGVRHVITSKGTAFCWAPKVLRAAMGAHFGLHITESIEPADLLAHVAPALPIRMLQAPGAGRVVHDVYDSDLTAPGGWVFGSEGSGVRDALFGSRVLGLSIDQAEGVESLNVAAAVAISLFEARRQRRRGCR
jgi:TrmH family RNA methyltransferase